MFYDVHTHAFLPKLAERICQQLYHYYGIWPVGSGLIEDLLEREKRAGIDKVVMLNAATTPNQVVPANDWTISLQNNHPGQVVSFGTLHPKMSDWPRELERLKYAGIRGLKFHPEFQGFWMDDPGLFDIMEAAWHDFIFLFHVGDKPAPADNPSCPYKVAALANKFPQARIIAAHLGGYLHWSAVIECLVGRKIYLDTSSSLKFIDEMLLQEIFKRHQREYLLFGSDYPLFDPGDEVGLLKKRLRLTQAEIEILMSNARTLFDQL